MHTYYYDGENPGKYTVGKRAVNYNASACVLQVSFAVAVALYYCLSQQAPAPNT